LAELVPAALGDLTVERSMRWAAGSPIAFSRPIRWIVCLLGDAVVPFTYGTVASGRTTRLLRNADRVDAEVRSAGDHGAVMTSNSIVVDQAERQSIIEADARQLVSSIGGQVDLDLEAPLVDEIVNLVENPVTFLGRFDETFLRLPPEVLTVVMKKHQRYLPVRDQAGQLLNAFVGVANGPVDVDAVRRGNEAVLRARYTDAAFFYDRDLAVPLETFRDGLTTLMFEVRAGSMLDRSNRVTELAGHLAVGLDDADRRTVARAAPLAMLDLASQMVIELSTLAGVMGSIYAAHAGEPADVVAAIREHVLPRQPGDALPASRPGAMLALALRIDALVALFAVGVQPTGSNDPYALRRAAAGMVQILIEMDLDLDLDRVFAFSAGLQPVDVDDAAMAELAEFVARRVERRLLEDGHAPMLVQSVLANASRPALAARVLRDLEDLAGSEQLTKVAAAYKRIGRISRDISPESVRTDLLVEDAEKALWVAYEDVAERLGGGPAALHRLVSVSSDLADAVNRFFDAVMVMSDDAAVRSNRLAMLATIRDLGAGLVDWDSLPDS